MRHALILLLALSCRKDFDPATTDDDGDGLTPATGDCSDADAAIGVGSDWFADADGDGFGTSETLVSCGKPDGYAAVAGDCDDADDTVNPANAEVCDDVDNNCDGATDESGGDQVYYADVDGDGSGAGPALIACSAPEGYVATDDDCDDDDADVHPGAAETDCDDATDYNCDGLSGFEDHDGDGFAACDDCDDNQDDVNDDAEEVCNGVDDDCDGTTDQDASDPVTWYLDDDDDGFGSTDVQVVACDAPTTSTYTEQAGDCDDDHDTVNPDAIELCNALDEDCDGTSDEGVATSTWYEDKDGDGHGSAATSKAACAAPAGFVASNTDCDDTDLATFQGAVEACNAKDDDCDGAVDEGVATRYYADTDSDGFGNLASTKDACALPAGYVANALDCDDAQNAVRPGATETCNAKDDDCDTLVDDGAALVWYRDNDNDTFGDASTSKAQCTQPTGYVASNTDCNDASATANPGATEVVGNDADDNCDTKETCYVDADDDNYGSATATSTDTDCNDANEGHLPGECNDTNSSFTTKCSFNLVVVDVNGGGFSDGTTITELVVLDNTGTPVTYTTTATDAYDSSITNQPSYWNLSSWGRSNLNNGNIVYTSNGTGQTSTTYFNCAATSCFARFRLSLPANTNVSAVRMTYGSPESRIPQDVKFYAGDSTTYNVTTNVVGRSNTNLTYFGHLAGNSSMTSVFTATSAP